MALYPSLESLNIDKEVKAQHTLENAMVAAVANAQPGCSVNYGVLASTFLGVDLSLVTYDDFGNPHYRDPGTVMPKPSMPMVPTSAAGPIVPRDPVQVSQQVREIILKKDRRGLLGIQLKDMDAGVFVTYVEEDSPAAMAGLRFGDQVLKIDDEYMAGKKGKKAMKFVKKQCGETVAMFIRDRPLERVVTLTKDSHGSVGLLIEDGLIKSIVKDSSAERNGVLINTYICEVNGVNVLGMSDKKIRHLLEMASYNVKLTLIPRFYYDNLTKKLGRSQWKNMDHTMPLY